MALWLCGFVALYGQCYPLDIIYTVDKATGFPKQHAKKVVYDSPGLVDFTIGLVIFVLNLPNGQVLFFGEIQITEGL